MLMASPSVKMLSSMMLLLSQTMLMDCSLMRMPCSLMLMPSQTMLMAIPAVREMVYLNNKVIRFKQYYNIFYKGWKWG